MCVCGACAHVRMEGEAGCVEVAGHVVCGKVREGRGLGGRTGWWLLGLNSPPPLLCGSIFKQGLQCLLLGVSDQIVFTIIIIHQN